MKKLIISVFVLIWIIPTSIFAADVTIQGIGVQDTALGMDSLIETEDDPSGTPTSKYVTIQELSDTIIADIQDTDIPDISATYLTVAGTDNIKDTHIDWGTGAGQVSADDMGDGSTNAIITLTQETNFEAAYSALHTQNTDTGTTQGSFQIDSGNSGPRVKNNSGTLEVRDSADSALAPLSASAVTITTGLFLTNGLDMRVSTTTAAHEWSLQIYDNDDITWRNALTPTNGDEPTMTYGAVKHDFTGAGSVNFGPFVLATGTNPTVSNEGGAAWETDEDGIRVYDGAANRLIGTVITESYTILQPDVAQAETDDLIIYHFDARWYPFGVKMLGYTISTSASSSDTYLLEEWDDEAGSTQVTSESIALSTATRAEDDGTLSDADFAADSYLNVNLDDSQDDISYTVVSFAFYVKTGD